MRAPTSCSSWSTRAARLVQQLLSTATVGAGMTSDVMLTGTVATPHLWNGRSDPYLYTAYVQVGQR